MERTLVFDSIGQIREKIPLRAGAAPSHDPSSDSRPVGFAAPSPAMTFLNDETYRQLHGVATSILSRQELRATMSPGDLLHDALVQLSGSSKQILCFDLAHFKALTVRLIKRALLDHVRRFKAQKRTDGSQKVPLESVVVRSRDFHSEMFELRETLSNFARVNARAGMVLSRRLFHEARIEEIATELTVSVRTVKRDLQVARRRMYPEFSNRVARGLG